MVRTKKNTITIGNRTVGPGYPAFIVAELSCNHLQKAELAVETVYAMKKAGVDAVKVQTYTPDTITVDSNLPEYQINKGTLWDGMNLHKLYEEAYTPWEWQPTLKGLAEMLGMAFFSSPFDESAVDFLSNLNVPAYKVASFEIQDIPLIRHMAKQGKPMIMSTGIASLEDIELAVETCREEGNDQIVLLKCTSAYPSPFEEINLRTMPDMAERFGTLVGLSDHTLGSTVPIAAVALGACIIEKHFILDRSMGGHDGPFSMEPHEWEQMIKEIRNTEAALGKVTYELGEKAKKGKEFGRSLRAVSDIKRGEKFTKENVKSKRPAGGLHPKYYEEILGKKAKVDIEKGAAITREMFE